MMVGTADFIVSFSALEAFRMAHKEWENEPDLNDENDDAEADEIVSANNREVSISEDGLTLRAVVSVPDVAKGLVIFAHGSSSDRFSPRNQFISREFNKAGFATVCADLLTEDESVDRMNVFDIDLLASRITMISRWAAHHSKLRGVPVALFGSNTGAAAALKAAAQLGDRVQAVISRGGRLDLASDILQDVQAPTLLIVGSEDTPIIGMNEWVMPRLTAVHELAIIDGADHLFEEKGALEKVASLSLTWLERFLKSPIGWKSVYSPANQAYII